MNRNVIIVNPDKLARVKESFRHDGPDSVHVLSDFDRTLTYHSQNGHKNSALIAVISGPGYMPPAYGEQAKALFNKYFPIEHDPKVPLAEKKAAMVEWWSSVFNLLIAHGLTKDIIERAIKECRTTLREGVEDWLELLNRLKIPLVIFSASGLGRESIEIFLGRLKKHDADIHIMSNSFIWDKSGRAIGINDPIIHSYNKDETLVQDFPFYEEIKNRRNVILLGDSFGDVGMVEGFEYDNLLKIGFLSEKVEENMSGFKDVYDVIILGDDSFDYINSLFREIFIIDRI
jgi:cytosolic 5'-nucleotidase 3